MWWLLWGGTVALGLRLRRSRSKGWTLYKIVLAVLSLQALKMSAYLAYADGFRRGDPPGTINALYMAYIPFNEAAESSFLGLLLLLASGFCITRADMGAHKPKVYGIPIILFVTGVVTDVIYLKFTDSVSDEVDFLSMAPWEQALWFVCTLLNVACLMLAWVYSFDIIAQETEALEAQEAANKRTTGAGAAQAAPDGRPLEAEGAAPHAAAPTELDEELGRAGVVVYKTLMSGGQNASHIAGADSDAQEFETVADKLNFEIKKKLYKRFSFGVGAYLVATMCALLLPIYMNIVVQGVIVFLQFVVQWGFFAALVWIFRPVEDSPYLMIGTSLEHAEELGVTDLGTALGVEDDDDDGGFEDFEAGLRGTKLGRAVELGAVGRQREREQQQQQRGENGSSGGGAPKRLGARLNGGDAGGGARRDQVVPGDRKSVV